MKKTFKGDGIIFKADTKKDTVEVLIGKVKHTMKLIDLWGIVFSMTANEELKDKLLPVRQTEMMKFKKVHNVQLKNDMKAGEILTFACIIDVPVTVAEGIKNTETLSTVDSSIPQAV